MASARLAAVEFDQEAKMVPEVDQIAQRVELLTFDCYGTLIDWERGIITALDTWTERRGVAKQDSETLLENFAIAESEIQVEYPKTLYSDILKGVLRRLGEQLEIETTEQDCELFAASVEDWPAFEDSPAALERLSKRFDLMIVSNVDQTSLAASMAHLRLQGTTTVTAEEVGAYKPDRRMFLRALEVAEGLGYHRDEMLHCAQSLFHDHVPAQRLGLSTAWINRRGGKDGWGATRAPAVSVEPQLEVGSLAQLARVLGC